MQVQVFDTGKLDRGGFQLISSTDVFGSVDTWKNYVAIGFLNLQLLKIDNTLSFLRKVLLRQNEVGRYQHPQLMLAYVATFIVNRVKHILTLWYLLRGGGFSLTTSHSPIPSHCGQKWNLCGLHQTLKVKDV